MVKLTSSFARALSIATILQSEERIMFDKHIWYIDAYQNGREQGITIWDGSRICYYISEHRNSDEIVIYKGKYIMQSLSDDAYKHPNFFTGIEIAVHWLIAELVEKENKND